MQSAKRLHKNDQIQGFAENVNPRYFSFLFQNFNLLPYKSQTQVTQLLSASLTSQCSLVDFSSVKFSFVDRDR